MSAAENVGGEPTEDAPRDPAARRRRDLPKPHPATFRIGLALMIVSFALYPVYGVILALPVAQATKVELGFAAWAASWGAFTLGSALAGAEGLESLRRLARRRH